MTVAVVIPFRGGDPQRERNLEWTVARYNDRLAPAELVFGGCDPDLPFNRSAAILDGTSKVSADAVVVADGDCWSDGTIPALEAVADGEPWAVPHLKLHRLSEASTELVLAGEEPHARMEHAERPYNGHECGTLLAIRRDVLLDVRPDIRFRAWGQEDDAWSVALRTLVGKPWRGVEPCWHLHHEPQPRISRNTGSNENRALYRRYVKARSNPTAMRALIDEAKAVTV